MKSTEEAVKVMDNIVRWLDEIRELVRASLKQGKEGREETLGMVNRVSRISFGLRSPARTRPRPSGAASG
jgi:hypothetical protein